MIVSLLIGRSLQATDLSGLWVAVIFASIVAAIALAFGFYQAQRGIVPGQRQAMQELSAKLSEQQVLISALQRQTAEQWVRIAEQDRKMVKLQTENDHLNALTKDQDAIIKALQRQLGGLARGNVRTGRRLREVLTKRLNEEELRVWASDLEIPFDNLKGDSLPALVVSMLETLERYGRLEEGLAELRRIRPDIPLEDM